MVYDILISLWVLQLVFGSMGTQLNQADKVAFAFGLISPIIIFGIAASASLPLVIMNDLLAVLFSNKMWRKWKAWTFPQHYSLMQSLPKVTGDGRSMPSLTDQDQEPTGLLQYTVTPYSLKNS